MKYLVLLFLIVGQAHASLKDIEVIQYKDRDEKAGIALLKSLFEEGHYLNRTTTFAFEAASQDKTTQKNQYSNGDFVILWGVGEDDKDQNITKTEYQKMWSMMNYLSKKNFRVVMNVRATAEDLADALSSKTSSVVAFSSHGNEKRFYDFNSNPVPTNIFSNRAPNVYQFILSACYGSYALQNYKVPTDLYVYSWPGLTNPNEFINFLVSDDYSALTGKKK